MSFATRYRNLSIKYKLRIVIMLTVIAALILACTMVLVYDQVAARDSMRNDLGVLADILSSNSTAALSFTDSAAANELLSTLVAKHHIVTALIYSADGKTFASYRRAQEPNRPVPSLRRDGSWFESERLVLFRSILFGGQLIGTIYVESDLEELNTRLRRFTGFILGILVAASFLALLLSSKLQEVISKPIAHLAQVAKAVSYDKNYATRAVKSADDDLGKLTETFNEMLSEIELRDATLLTHQNRLEIEVAKRTEELGRSEARYRSTLESAPDAIVVTNAEGNIVLVNTQTERTFGRPREALLGRNMDLLFPERLRPEQANRYERYFAPVQTTTEAVTEMTALREDDTEFSIEISTSRLETEEGVLVFSAMRDVTERKNAEQRSRQLEVMAKQADAANKAKSMFLSTMSHEIRTPMNAILGYAQLMLRDPTLGTEAKANLKIINRSGEHLLNIINDVLDMAKIEAGRLTLTPQTINVHGFLQDIESMFRLRAEVKGVQFDVHVSGEPPEYIVADEGKIRQVLINLLGNATKFTEHGRIDMRVSLDYRTNHRLWFSAQVEDTGIGLTAEEQSKLFQPFVQARGGEHVHNGGTGLGLAISRGVAELMSGTITVCSTAGSGSTFCFEIPVECGTGAGSRGPTAALGRVLGIQAGQDAPRILIADDVADNREWLKKLLTALGFSVRLAKDGEEAVRVWGEWRPGLILMDVHMPLMDGLEATRRIKANPFGKSTVIVALTASALDEDRRAALQSGADDFLAKPCLEGELLEKMRVLLNLVYDHEELSKVERGLVAGSAALSAEMLGLIPMELVQELRNATLAGNKTALDSLIRKVGQTEDETAHALQDLADNYDYDALTSLLEVACH